jgi:hypothetical protein
MKISEMMIVGVMSSVTTVHAGTFVALGYDQWKPSLATPIVLTAGTWELTPRPNPDGRWDGVSAFFSGDGWNSWQWNVAVWNSRSDAFHATTNLNRMAWFRTRNHGISSHFDLGGAAEAYAAALTGERDAGSTGYPGSAPYRFDVLAAGTYYFGIYDTDLTNNRGGVFFDLQQVPAPSAGGCVVSAAAWACLRRRRRGGASRH